MIKSRKKRARKTKKPKPLSIWIIDDDEQRFDLPEELRISSQHFEDLMTAHKCGGHPDIIVIDLSAIGSIIGGPSFFYSGICNIISKHPGASIVINSAVSSSFAECVREEVIERCPDAIVRLVDWAKSDPQESLHRIIRELAGEIPNPQQATDH